MLLSIRHGLCAKNLGEMLGSDIDIGPQIKEKYRNIPVFIQYKPRRAGIAKSNIENRN
jgi:hypothetical protein